LLGRAYANQATTNPLVVVEVLHPGGESDDNGDKRRDFQSLASLQVHVLAAQDARCVTVYRRTERGDWRDGPDVYRDGASCELSGADTRDRGRRGLRRPPRPRRALAAALTRPLRKSPKC